MLIKGFQIINGEIISTLSKEPIKDVPVLQLKLSNKAKIALYNELHKDAPRKELMLSDILPMSLLELVFMDDMDDMCMSVATEIKNAAKEYLDGEVQKNRLRQKTVPAVPDAHATVSADISTKGTTNKSAIRTKSIPKIRTSEERKKEVGRIVEELRKEVEEEWRLSEERRKAEERRAEEWRIEAERRVAEEKRLEEERRLAEARRLEEQRKIEEERRQAEERRAAEEKRLEEERRVAEEKRREEERRITEEKRRKESERIIEELRRKRREEERIIEELRRKRREEERKIEEELRIEEERRAKRREEEKQKEEGETEEECNKTPDSSSWNSLRHEKSGGFVFTNADVAVLALDFLVQDGIIVHKGTGQVIQDALIEVLNLSVRSNNCLRRAKMDNISQLVGMPYDSLLQIRNLGRKSADEVQEKLEEYLAQELEQMESGAAEGEKDALSEAQSTDFQNPALEKILLLEEGVDFAYSDSDDSVLASEYFVYNGMIVHKGTGKIIQDASIEVLKLSVRAFNCLTRWKLTTLSSLVGTPFATIKSIKNMGYLSANEVQEKLELYLDRARKLSYQQVGSIRRTLTEKRVLDCFDKNGFEWLSFDTINDRLVDAESDQLWEIIASLVDKKKIICREGKYQLVHPSFCKQIAGAEGNPDRDGAEENRSLQIVRLRAEGNTLGEIGRKLGITRERVRQIEAKTLKKITQNNTICFEEDKYGYLFKKYSLSKEFFFTYLKETSQVWYYLNGRYEKGQKDLSEALEDGKLSVEVRRIIEQYLRSGYMQIEGEYVLAQRSELEDYVLKKYCKDEVTLEEFFALYNQFLAEHGITDESLQLTDGVRATRHNRLAESKKLLWKQNRKLRYYDVENQEYTELLEALNLGQYKNIEISTLKFFEEFPELMRQYDLRDEYEVHNLLKKIHAEKENPNLVFGRMPNIQFGTFDRDAAVKEVMFALAPVSQDDLAEMLYLEYGTRMETIKANWLTCVSEYYHQGMYSVDSEPMPQEHMELLKKNLTEDFYYLTELKKMYARLVPKANLELLSPYNLKRMGFLVASTYVIQNYPTAEAYFRHLLLDEDVADIQDIYDRYGSLTTFTACLNTLKTDLEIIEFEPYQYINIRRLEKLGYGKERLKQYRDRVWSFLAEESFFTIQSLRKAGFEDELDALGFGELFYASILKGDERFSHQRIGGSVVFSSIGKPFSMQDFLVDYIEKVRSIDLDDFLDELREEYGIVTDRSNVLMRVKDSDVYYDAIMEKLYDNYETYFDEI